MSHQLSLTQGITSFADSQVIGDRVAAWHRLGTPVGHEMTAQEALEAAHLANWNVRKVPLWADLRDENGNAEVHGLKVPGKYGVVFNNPVTGNVQTMPATVGERYEHAQNEDLATFGEVLVDEVGQRNWQTAGALREYTQIFLTMKLPQTMVLEAKDGQQDVTEYYLALLNSHDGSTSITGLITPVRIVCANTQSAAIHGTVSSFKIRHTSGWRNALEEARRILGLSFRYEKAFEEEAKALFAAELSNEEAKALSEELVELSKVDRDSTAATRRQNQANHIYKLFVESPTIVGSVGGTKYGFYNAVTEYVDHYQGVRGANGDEAGARALRTITAAQSNTGLKADAWRLLVN